MLLLIWKPLSYFQFGSDAAVHVGLVRKPGHEDFFLQPLECVQPHSHLILPCAFWQQFKGGEGRDSTIKSHTPDLVLG